MGERGGGEGSTHECRKMGMKRKEFTFHIGLFILNLCAEGLHVNTVQPAFNTPVGFIKFGVDE